MVTEEVFVPPRVNLELIATAKMITYESVESIRKHRTGNDRITNSIEDKKMFIKNLTWELINTVQKQIEKMYRLKLVYKFVKFISVNDAIHTLMLQ